MASAYYKPCPELDRCNALIDQYWYSGQYDLCFRGHLELAEQGYPLAECQVGYFYGSTAQFGKSIRPKILPHTKVIKGREYCMYFPLL